MHDIREEIKQLHAAKLMSTLAISRMYNLTREQVRHIIDPDHRRKRDKLYRSRHPERIRARQTASYHKNLTFYRAKHRKAYQKHRKQYIQAQLEWAKRNPLTRKEIENRRRARKRKLETTPISKKQLLQLFDSFDGRCAYCFDMKPLTLDHILPLSKGGPHILSNLTVCCQSCNSSKSDSLLKDWLWRPERG